MRSSVHKVPIYVSFASSINSQLLSGYDTALGQSELESNIDMIDIEVFNPVSLFSSLRGYNHLFTVGWSCRMKDQLTVSEILQ